MTLPAPAYRNLRRGIELGFINGWPLVYDGTEPVAIDAQAGNSAPFARTVSAVIEQQSNDERSCRAGPPL